MKRLSLAGTLRSLLLFAIIFIIGWLAFRSPQEFDMICTDCDGYNCTIICSDACKNKLYDNIISNFHNETGVNMCTCTCESTLNNWREDLLSGG